MDKSLVYNASMFAPKKPLTEEQLTATNRVRAAASKFVDDLTYSLPPSAELNECLTMMSRLVGIVDTAIERQDRVPLCCAILGDAFGLVERWDCNVVRVYMNANHVSDLLKEGVMVREPQRERLMAGIQGTIFGAEVRVPRLGSPMAALVARRVLPDGSIALIENGCDFDLDPDCKWSLDEQWLAERIYRFGFGVKTEKLQGVARRFL